MHQHSLPTRQCVWAIQLAGAPIFFAFHPLFVKNRYIHTHTGARTHTQLPVILRALYGFMRHMHLLLDDILQLISEPKPPLKGAVSSLTFEFIFLSISQPIYSLPMTSVCSQSP